MSVYHPPVGEHENVIKAVLRVIASTHYQSASGTHADAEQQYAEEQLALAARALVRAVDRKDPDGQPVGWDKPEFQPSPCSSGLLPLGSGPVEPCIVRGRHYVHETADGRKWTNEDASLEEITV
ncbi:hypothetical protein AB0G67_40265 [Streptomyces sp. NPDC021056]|uniref:hypothetical protein n=1 Tax=Streptomyces sp. NPDC021056 TaxID=3155012 RepID=UPI0033D1471F